MLRDEACARSPRACRLQCGPLAACLHGCNFLEDNGTHLAYALEKGAGQLRASGARELVVRYETLDGPAQSY